MDRIRGRSLVSAAVGIAAVSLAAATLDTLTQTDVGAFVTFSLTARTGPELAVGAVGAAVFLAGLVRQSRRRVTVGAVGLLLGTVPVGLSGAPPSLALVGVTATVVAWDAAGMAIALGDQLGRAADTACVEAVHLTATALVGVLAANVGYVVYRAATGGQPIVALLSFLLAATLLASADGYSRI